MREHTIEHRVTYKETDQMRVVYYSNYLIWFEMVRTEYFRAKGLVYKELEDNEKIFLPVTEAQCVYKAPVKYDDLIEIKATLSEIGKSRITFEYEVIKDGNVTTTGYTKHVFVNGTGRAIPVPDRIKEYLTK
ncbi:MAG: thioesterase family protein [Candidatus Omnitrophota bacterium]